MKLRILTGLVLVSFLAAAPVAVHAQLRGMLKKKADEMLKGKPDAPAPTEKAAPAPAPTTPTGSSSSGSKPADAPQARAEAKPPADPLDVSAMNLTTPANQLLGGEGQGQVPYISDKIVKAAKGLDEAARVAFVQKVGAAFKALVMSDAFQKSHTDHIKSEYKAVDHGLKGLVSMEDMAKKGNYEALAPMMERMQAGAVVEATESMSAEDIKRALADEMEGWTRHANDPKGSDRVRYQKFVADGKALQALGPADIVKLRRGFAVLRSADNDGPSTEAALYAAAERSKAELEQLSYDEHNLKAELKRQLTAFVGVVQTVDFAAATTTLKNGSVVFTNKAYEAKGSTWKACFRAGKGPSTAALTFAQAWLKEL